MPFSGKVARRKLFLRSRWQISLGAVRLDATSRDDRISDLTAGGRFARGERIRLSLIFSNCAALRNRRGDGPSVNVFWIGREKKPVPGSNSKPNDERGEKETGVVYFAPRRLRRILCQHECAFDSTIMKNLTRKYTISTNTGGCIDSSAWYGLFLISYLYAIGLLNFTFHFYQKCSQDFVHERDIHISWYDRNFQIFFPPSQFL